jgi:hypothetical protein
MNTLVHVFKEKQRKDRAEMKTTNEQLFLVLGNRPDFEKSQISDSSLKPKR